MAPACDGLAFRAAEALVARGVSVPNGYTEPVLNEFRRKSKGRLRGLPRL